MGPAGRTAHPSRRIPGLPGRVERFPQDVRRTRPVAGTRSGAQRRAPLRQRQRTNRTTQHRQKEPQLPLRFRRSFLSAVNRSLLLLLLLSFFSFFFSFYLFLHLDHLFVCLLVMGFFLPLPPQSFCLIWLSLICFTLCML